MVACFHSLLEEDVNGAAFCVLNPSWDFGDVFIPVFFCMPGHFLSDTLHCESYFDEY